VSQTSGNDRESVRLSDESARTLLTRATELDSARLSGASIAELRAAAVDAGIAPEAFEQALAEAQSAALAAPARTESPWLGRVRWTLLISGGVFLMALVAVILTRLLIS